MADTTQRGAFDRLSRSFGETSLSCMTFDSQSSAGQLTPESQSTEHPDELLFEFLGYKEWLNNVKLALEAAVISRREKQGSTTGRSDLKELNARILDLKEELLKESSKLSIKELTLKRLQLTNTLLSVLFPETESGEDLGASGVTAEEENFRDLVTKQSQLVTEILGHHAVCQSTQKELDATLKQSLKTKQSNREITTKLSKLKEEQKQNSVAQATEKHQRKQSEIERTLGNIKIEQNVLQGLIVGSGVNWAQDDNMREFMLGLGRPLKL